MRAVPASVRYERIGHLGASLSEVSERQAGHPDRRGRVAQGLSVQFRRAVAGGLLPYLRLQLT